MGVFRLEAEIEGVNEFFRAYDGLIKKLDKLREVSPTDFKY